MNEAEKRRFKRLLHEYALSASIHGLHHVIKKDTVTSRKVLWLLIIICCLSALGWNLRILATRYFSYTKQTSIQMNFGSLIFPAITVCSLNPLLASQANRNQKFMQMMNAYKTVTTTQESSRIIERIEEQYGFSPNIDRIELQQHLEWNLASLLREMEHNSTLEEGAIPFEGIVKNCAYNAGTCSKENFTQVFDPTYGTCYVFNGLQRDPIKATRAGPNYGLKLLLYTNLTEYIDAATTIGCRIVIHDQGSPPFPDTFGHSLQPSSAVAMSVRPVTNERLKGSDPPCTETEVNPSYFYDGKYTTEGCLRSCQQRNVIQECRCADPRFPVPKNTEYCRLSDRNTRTCIDSSFWRRDSCNCPLRCKERTFDTTTSSAKWRKEAASSLCKEENCNAIIESAILLNVFFENLNEQIIVESFSYPLVNFLSDTAGQCGFWIGLSFLGFVEFGVFLLSVFSNIIPSPQRIRHLFYAFLNRKYKPTEKKAIVIVGPEGAKPSTELPRLTLSPTETSEPVQEPSSPPLAYTHKKRNPIGSSRPRFRTTKRSSSRKSLFHD